MPQELHRLDQRALFKGDRSFSIQDNGTIVATYSGKLRRELILNLVGINPNFSREKHIARGMIIGMVFFLVPALGWLWAAIRSPWGTTNFFSFGGVFLVFLLPFALCWQEYIRQSYDVLIFLEPMTGNRLILLKNVPDEASVNAFVGALEAAIQKARDQIVPTSAGPASLSDELIRLAQLRDKGVLSEAEFQQAKAALLGSIGGKPNIGFHS